MAVALNLAKVHRVDRVCEALGVNRLSLYREQARLHRAAQPRTTDPAVREKRLSPRALSSEERRIVLETLHSDPFVDKSPPQVYANLLDAGVYLCSMTTMYRLLRAQGEVRERRNQLRHPVYTAPELLATAPHQVWSWDITKLYGPGKLTYYYLYVILDLYSRYVTGWTIASRESAELAEEFIAQSCEKQQIAPGQLTLHADRGSAMTSKPVAYLLADLGVTKTHSRPHVSNDNPYSEAQFKTLKYRPDFPARFGSIEDARAHCHRFFRWYNTDHCHSGIGLLTPATVHYGRADQAIAQRQAVLTVAYRVHPERFVGKPPVPPSVPTAVWINPPKGEDIQRDSS